MAVSTVQTTGDIPDVLKPFYEGPTGLISRGIASIYPTAGDVQASQAYYQQQFAPVIQAGLAGAGGVAPMSQAQQAAGERIAGMQMPGAFGMAAQTGQAAGAGFTGLQGLQAMGVAAPELTTYQMAGPQMFGSQQAQQYMSPYMQAVVDAQQRNAVEMAKRAQLDQNLAAARQGTYGGARQALLQGERESGLRSQLGDIQARGLQSAYEQAQAQFERDRAAQQGVAGQNLAAALGVQQLGSGQSLEAQRANQAAALQAAQQRLGASQGLAGLTGTLGGLGTQQLGAEMDLTKALGAFGDVQRGITQQEMDAQRQFLTNQATYGQQQVGMLSNLLRGIPMTDSTQTQTTPAPSFASQLAGAGLTGLSLFNLLGK